MIDTQYWFDRPADTDLIVLWKVGRDKEVAVFNYMEARELQRSLVQAIKSLDVLEDTEEDA